MPDRPAKTTASSRASQGTLWLSDIQHVAAEQQAISAQYPYQSIQHLSITFKDPKEAAFLFELFDDKPRYANPFSAASALSLQFRHALHRVLAKADVTVLLVSHLYLADPLSLSLLKQLQEMALPKDCTLIILELKETTTVVEQVSFLDSESISYSLEESHRLIVDATKRADHAFRLACPSLAAEHLGNIEAHISDTLWQTRYDDLFTFSCLRLRTAIILGQYGASLSLGRRLLKRCQGPEDQLRIRLYMALAKFRQGHVDDAQSLILIGLQDVNLFVTDITASWWQAFYILAIRWLPQRSGSLLSVAESNLQSTLTLMLQLLPFLPRKWQRFIGLHLLFQAVAAGPGPHFQPLPCMLFEILHHNAVTTDFCQHLSLS